MKEARIFCHVFGVLVAIITHWYGMMSAQAEPWNFVVIGDTRGNSSSDPVNTTILSELATSIAAEDPAFVLVSGDLVYSGSVSAFQAWTNVMRPVYQAGIPVYPVIGNHDLGGGFDTVLGARLPDNGPAGEKRRTYAVVHSNVLVLALDTYVNPGQVNLAWVKGWLSSNTLPHVFALGHLPAFKVNHADTLDDHASSRNEFWIMLEKAGAHAYFCGHDHFFDHARIDNGDGNPDNDVAQYITGGGGAPLYSDGAYDGVNGNWIPRRIHHEKNYGYLKVEVDRLKVTLTYKNRSVPGVYTAMAEVDVRTVTPQVPLLNLSVGPNGSSLGLSIQNLTPSSSNRIEMTTDLGLSNWLEVGRFEGTTPVIQTNLVPVADRTLYRVYSQ